MMKSSSATIMMPIPSSVLAACGSFSLKMERAGD
jgi:hypothetical protein